MKSARDGGQTAGIATPLKPFKDPVLMLKTGTSVGETAPAAVVVLLFAAEGEARTAIPFVDWIVGSADALSARRESVVRVLRKCMVADVLSFQGGNALLIWLLIVIKQLKKTKFQLW